MKLHRRVKLLVLAVGVELALTGATWPLHPLVEINAAPLAVMPPGCEEGLTPAPVPRVEVKQIPAPEIVPVSIPAPPSRSLRSEIESAHGALTHNDRPALDEHLRNARSILAGYPPGAERTAVEEVVRVLDDAARVWDAQFESPFFDEKSEVYGRLSRYPGYVDAVRRSMFNDDADRRYYPAAESRDFLTRLAADRLTRLGVKTETRVARAERVSTPPATTVAPRESTTAPKRTFSRRGSSSSRAAGQPKPSAKPKPSIKPDPKPTPGKPAAPAKSAPSSTAATASPVADLEAAAGAAASTTAAPSTTAAAEVPVPTETVATTTTSAPDKPPATEPERRSVVVPALLILIGLGVLIVLFRASK